MPQIGYVKDMTAVFGFIFSIVFISLTNNINKYKNLIIYLLGVCFLVDGFFSLNSKYHCLELGNNKPTYVMVFGSILAIGGLSYYLIKG